MLLYGLLSANQESASTSQRSLTNEVNKVQFYMSSSSYFAHADHFGPEEFLQLIKVCICLLVGRRVNFTSRRQNQEFNVMWLHDEQVYKY